MVLASLGSWDKIITFSSSLLIMNGFMLLSANTLSFFTYQITDDAFCYTTQLPGLHRDPNKQLRYFQFIEYFYHALDVPKIEGVQVQTGRHCLLRCVKNDRCFSANTGAFHLPNGNVSCDLLPLTSTLSPRSSKRIMLSITTALWWVSPSFISFVYLNSPLIHALLWNSGCVVSKQVDLF